MYLRLTSISIYLFGEVWYYERISTKDLVLFMLYKRDKERLLDYDKGENVKLIKLKQKEMEHEHGTSAIRFNYSLCT